MKKLSTREATMRAIMELAETDERIVLVSPDSVLAARATPFAQRFSERLIEVGIAEQCAVDVAAGLAAVGMRPVVITYAGFLTMRACEMMRTFVAYPHLDVKFVGLNGGMLGGEREGVTHQFYEDLGILRAMPGYTILTPADAHQAYRAALSMFETEGPVYLRLANGREPEVFTEQTPYDANHVQRVLSYGADAVIFASGYIMDRAMAAAEMLRAEGIGVTLVNVPCLKPLDAQGVARELEAAGRAVTVEDHNIYGALGSAVCEVACERFPCRVERVGLGDVYPRSGHAEALLSAYGLDATDIAAAVKRVMR